MTIQTKHFIELSDLVALRFVCKHCDATLTMPLSDAKLTSGQDSPHMFLSACPSCHYPWADTYEPIIRRATVALKRLQDILSGELKAPLGFDLTVEIKTGAVPPPNDKKDVA